MAKILVVDDERKMCVILKGMLEDRGHHVTALQEGTKAQELIGGQEFDLVITDLKMAPVDGLELLKAIKKVSPDTEVVLMTAYASVQTAIEAMKQGAYDYIIKPFDLEEMGLLVDKIAEKRRLVIENRQLREDLSSKGHGEMVLGNSPKMRQVMSMVAKVAQSDVTVLIRGESGTGKELVAEAIHLGSSRSQGPLVVVNCAALTETLLESELFGHERGAFTGAIKKKLGRFELAHGGTIFLDEVGDISPNLQAKLLRVLQEKKFVRVGGTETIAVDVRLIAATNRNLEQAIGEGTFREDLYYRLSVFPIEVPALRERPEDVPPLVEHFLKAHGRGLDDVEGSAMDQLAAYRWPGNVRELENVIERAVILAGGDRIEPSHLPFLASAESAEASVRGELNLEQLERDSILRALRQSGGNKTEAARLLGITRRALYSRMERLGLREPSRS
jgi:two-component system NtrC family response regulator